MTLKIVNGQQILILGKHEMTVEEFKEMARSLISKEKLEAIEKGKYKDFPRENLMRIE